MGSARTCEGGPVVVYGSSASRLLTVTILAFSSYTPYCDLHGCSITVDANPDRAPEDKERLRSHGSVVMSNNIPERRCWLTLLIYPAQDLPSS